jgi:hypothetical protein
VGLTVVAFRRLSWRFVGCRGVSSTVVAFHRLWWRSSDVGSSAMTGSDLGTVSGTGVEFGGDVSSLAVIRVGVIVPWMRIGLTSTQALAQESLGRLCRA